MIPCESAAQSFEVISKAAASRVTSSTAFNSTSSRSHLLLRIEVTQAGGLKGEVNFCDLAGSERLETSTGVGGGQQVSERTEGSLRKTRKRAKQLY